MSYLLSRQVCATFQVEGLLEDDEDEADPTKKRRQKMNVYDLFHLNYAELNVLAAKKKVPFHVRVLAFLCKLSFKILFSFPFRT